MRKLWEFVITGGPCSGKTTGLDTLESYFSKKGYKVIVVPETATEVIKSGILFKDVPASVFQEVVFDRSLLKEATTKTLAKYYDQDIIIFYDRGLMDGKAYMDPDGFVELLKLRGFTEEKVYKRYDSVFHMVTAANGAEKFYTVENNKARSEGIEEARELDEKTFDAWRGHKNLYRIDNSTSFDEKINRLINYVEKEIERKK